MANHIYTAIDLKSFYASVECIDRELDPLTTNLVVADNSRTEKTICLAVSPSLKAYGISGRARLFEVVQKTAQINFQRKYKAPQHKFTEKSYDDIQLKSNPALELDYIVAPPRMAQYIKVSTEIYKIYLKYIAPDDIHVYSIDEVFIDITHYLKTYKCTPRELTMMLVKDVLKTTGITATAGIGTNLYLAKIAMDIQAKHTAPDKNGVRIAQLDEMSYRKLLWSHRPLTDFWRIGSGYKKKLESNGMFTMGDIAKCSLGKENEFYNENLLYKLFGINAELLIDHAWGWEPCTIADIKSYKPTTSSLSSGQVLQCPYTFDKTRLIVREMAEALALDLVQKNLVTNQLVVTIGYDAENLSASSHTNTLYKGEITTDHYGRKIPKNAHGTAKTKQQTASAKLITAAVLNLFDRIVDSSLTIRRITIAACNLITEESLKSCMVGEQQQLSLFTDHEKEEQEKEQLVKEKAIQKAMIMLKERYGKNAVLKGTSLEEGATAMQRNKQIGGHRA